LDRRDQAEVTQRASSNVSDRTLQEMQAA